MKSLKNWVYFAAFLAMTLSACNQQPPAEAPPAPVVEEKFGAASLRVMGPGNETQY
jgi:hypothetical protein